MMNVVWGGGRGVGRGGVLTSPARIHSIVLKM